MRELILSLNTCETPRDISNFMRKHRVQIYTYGLWSTRHGDWINYGESSDNEWQRGTWGNRLYRKGGGIPGWNTTSEYFEGTFDIGLHDTSAQEMRRLCENLLPDLVKDDVIIYIHDYTMEPCLRNETDRYIKQFVRNKEHERIEHYKSENLGYAPKLNVQATRPGSLPIRELLDNFFEDS